VRSTHYTRYISSIVCNPYTIYTTLAKQSKKTLKIVEKLCKIGSSTSYAKSALLKVVTNCGSFNSFSVISHTGVRDPAYCLRFANPAEANGRQGRLEAGRLRIERTRIKREKPTGRFCMFWKHFGIHFGVQILPKSIPNRAGTIENRVREALLAPGVRRRCSMSALGVLGGIPFFVLAWFWVPESIQN